MASGGSGSSNGSGGRAERNSEAIEGVHQADRIAEISEFFVAEFGCSSFIVNIGNAGFGDACYGFCPGERGTFAGTEYFTRVAPHRHQYELVDGDPELE